MSLINPTEIRKREKKEKKYGRDKFKYINNYNKCKWIKPIYQSKIGIFSSLNVWKNSLRKPFGPRFVFVKM